MHNIGLIGKARSGKDTAALWLVRNRAYTRLAFADPLKEMALKINPIVSTKYDGTDFDRNRLASIVGRIGWESAKEFPEVRRLLQNIGQTQREFDESYWVNALARKLDNALAWNLPVVVTDVRYENEARMLRSRGFRLVRIIRPEAGAVGITAAHTSENELNGFREDVTIHNAGSIEGLHAAISAV